MKDGLFLAIANSKLGSRNIHGRIELVTYIHLRTQQGFVSQIMSIDDYHSPTRQTPLKGRSRSFSIFRDVSLTTFSKIQDSDTCSFLHPSRLDSMSIQRQVSFQSQGKTKDSLQQSVFSSRELQAFSFTVALWQICLFYLSRSQHLCALIPQEFRILVGSPDLPVRRIKHWLGVVSHTWNLSIQEADTEIIQAQGQPMLYREIL